MSAAGPDPRFRDQLAEALPESLGPVGLRRRAVPELGVEPEVTGYGEMLLNALAGVVARLVAQGVAERDAEIASCLLAHRDTNVRPGDGDMFGKGWNAALNFVASWVTPPATCPEGAQQ